MRCSKRIFLTLPFFNVEIRVNTQNLFDLVFDQFPDVVRQKPPHRQPSSQHIIAHFLKTPYSKLPRSKYDCFNGFTLFHNKFADHPFHKSPLINLDCAPRTLRTMVDGKSNTITAYIATPPDFEKHVLFDLIFFQPLKYLLQLHQLYFLHASCVAHRKGSILFSGKSGSGKTTLALALSRHDFRYVADEEIILFQEDSKIRCRGFPSRPKLRNESFALFPELKKQVVAKSPKKDKVLIRHDEGLFPNKVNKATPRILIFPKFVKTSSPRLEPVTKQAALNRLIKEEGGPVQFAPPNLEKQHSLFLAYFIRQVKVFRLFYRDCDLDKIPGLIRNILD